VNVLIADTAGQEKLKALSNQYYQKADGVLLVYDITNQASFDEIKNYYSKQIKDRCKFGVKVLLLGNKTDLEDERKISPETGANYAAENDFMFIETSCLKNENVAGGFETLIELTYRDVVQKEKEEMIILNGNHHQKQKTKSSCC
jgi:small GTP-binding protein